MLSAIEWIFGTAVSFFCFLQRMAHEKAMHVLTVESDFDARAGHRQVVLTVLICLQLACANINQGFVPISCNRRWMRCTGFALYASKIGAFWGVQTSECQEENLSQ